MQDIYVIQSNTMKTFKEKVLAVVASIPIGKVFTYKQVAQKAGHPRAYRAVGTIMRKNEDMKYIPCHRVIKSDGSAGSYSGPGGTRGKIKKLKKEGIILTI